MFSVVLNLPAWNDAAVYRINALCIQNFTLGATDLLTGCSPSWGDLQSKCTLVLRTGFIFSVTDRIVYEMTD